MIKIFLILILLSLFSLLVVLLIKEVKEKSYLSDHLISKIIEFILDEDITFGILFMIIMGLDPGLATMGFGVINLERGVYTVIDYGIVSTPKEDTLPVRLSKIEQGVTTLIETYKPSQISVEELFFSKNITTGISVAEARGVMLLTAVKLIGDEVYEYTPNQIKQAVTGYGGADKIQMQHMVQVLLRLKSVPRPDDAADALAVAICHAQTSRMIGTFKVQ